MADEWTDALNIATATLNTVNNSIGSKKTLKYSKEFANFQNILNRENYEYETQKNIELWNMQNQYNSPAETIQRLLAAGINPLTASDKFEPAGSPAAAKTENPDLAAAYQAQIAQLQFQQQAQLANAQIAKTNAETQNIEAQTKSQELTSEQQEITNSYLPQLLDGDMHSKYANVEFTKSQTGLTEQEKQNACQLFYQISEQTENIKVMRDQILETINNLKQQNKNLNQFFEQQEKKFTVELDNMVKAGKLTQEQAEQARLVGQYYKALATGQDLKNYEQSLNNSFLRQTQQNRIDNYRWTALQSKYNLGFLKGNFNIFKAKLPSAKFLAPIETWCNGINLGIETYQNVLGLPLTPMKVGFDAIPVGSFVK